MIGGAATVARRLLASGADAVTVIGGWSRGLDQVLRNDVNQLKPEEWKGVFKCIRAAETDFDTEKLRIYVCRLDGADRFTHRFDRDLSCSHHKEIDASWPDNKGVSAVVVTDFGKGLLRLPQVKDHLSVFTNIPIIVRPKMKEAWIRRGQY